MIDKKISNEELILLLQQGGNGQYFTLLAERHEKYILKKCASYVKDDDEAEDLCQEILIKLFLKVNDFKGQAKFSTWLFSIIHNTCIDHLRKSKKNVTQVITEKMVDEISEMIEGVDEMPEEITINILNKLLEEISPEEKLLLLMKYKEKHHIKDIQLTLGLSESAVKMRLKRAKEKLNKLYMSHRQKSH
ncbi:RNA polymerase sigma factor [Fulvivirga sediminis]|uniref:RNA polymerase sigma factor n=1 Tax=Fulvivirga sediminis TaxID=2803949 RepID=A0A937K110_9BACT|nr:RNA polymerase sigma factor [Fulvivirga sediminis]MBL3656951.1 RNA polymerase sigma factor [Fulvivirga sediminis]